MPVLFPGVTSAMTADPASAPRLVACFCADWCDTCRAYQSAFGELAEKYPQDCFVWIDIEAQPELLGDVDVENFPTLLIMHGEQSVFFGPLLPHISHLDRLLAQPPGHPVPHALPDLRRLLARTALN